MRVLGIVIFGIQFFALAVDSFAQSQVIYGSYKYTMGDNETKVDAKRNCFAEAKRRCLETAGTYLESVTEVRNFQLKNDEIGAYAAAFLKVEVVSEVLQLEGESLTISMSVKAVVDTTNMRQQIEQFRQESKLKSKQQAKDAEFEKLNQKIDSLQARISKFRDAKDTSKVAQIWNSGNKSPPKPTKEVTVFITRTGLKYHRFGCRYLRNSMITISLADAKKKYLPCSVCLPPM